MSTIESLVTSVRKRAWADHPKPNRCHTLSNGALFPSLGSYKHPKPTLALFAAQAMLNRVLYPHLFEQKRKKNYEY